MTVETLNPASAVNPKKDPDWTFTCFIPGKPMAKGSLRSRRGFLVDTDAVMAWVNKVVGHAIRDRMQRGALGDKSFPYEAPIELRGLFVFPRPHSQPIGPPITCSGPYAVGDLDKLVRAAGDALAVGKRNAKTIKAGVVKDDALFTEFTARKAFSDEGPDLQLGAYLKLLSAPEEPVDLAYYV